MADDIHKLVVPGRLGNKMDTDIIHRLICFPWAGAGASFFIRWDRVFPGNIQVLGVRLPGRDSRQSEYAYDDVSKAANDIADIIKTNYSDKPFSFLGHSIGAKVAFETARILKQKYDAQPVQLFLSGSFAPHSEKGRKILEKRIPKDITETFLVKYISDYGGTPDTILKDKEMLKLCLPPLKADLSMLMNYKYDEILPNLNCRLHVYDGEDDLDHFLEEWRRLTAGSFTVRSFKGGHFFFLDRETGLRLRDMVVNEIYATA